jgi:hypothetical protein
MDIPRYKLLRDSLFVRKGVSSGCPFCKGLIYTESPKVGDKIRILTEYMTGLVGEVIGDETCLPIRDSSAKEDEFSTSGVVYPRPGEIIVHENGSKNQTILFIKDDLFEPEPFSPVPNWAPDISFYEFAKFHTIIMQICNDSFGDSKYKYNRFALIHAITYILNRRLPINADEFWVILEAHGFPLKWKKHLVMLYEDCKEVVRVYHFMSSGRNYTRKKRVFPFSIE